MSENSKRQIAVVWETSYGKEDNGLILLIGVYDSLDEAVGVAVWQLNDDATANGYENCTISTLYNLEADAGLGMHLICKTRPDYRSRILILVNDNDTSEKVKY